MRNQLTPRQERFADLLAAGRDEWEAYHEAGYTGNNRSSLDRAKARVRDAVLAKQKHVQSVRIRQDEVTREEVIESLRETRLMAKNPERLHLKNCGLKRGDQTCACPAVSSPDLNAANKADELLGKTIGAYVDVKREQDLEAQLETMTDDEIQAFVLDQLKQLDPNYVRSLLGTEGGEDRPGSAEKRAAEVSPVSETEGVPRSRLQ